jgi:hypothetical protein
MSQKASRKMAGPVPVDLAKERARRGAETPLMDELGRRSARLVASVATRWRGHEPEIAILATTTFILTVAAAFAGADLLFTIMIVAVAAVTIWSPWRQSE